MGYWVTYLPFQSDMIWWQTPTEATPEQKTSTDWQDMLKNPKQRSFVSIVEMTNRNVFNLIFCLRKHGFNILVKPILVPMVNVTSAQVRIITTRIKSAFQHLRMIRPFSLYLSTNCPVMTTPLSLEYKIASTVSFLPFVSFLNVHMASSKVNTGLYLTLTKGLSGTILISMTVRKPNVPWDQGMLSKRSQCLSSEHQIAEPSERTISKD